MNATLLSRTPNRLRAVDGFTSGRKYRSLTDECIDREREQMGGLGPFERQRILERAPERVHTLLKRSREHPRVIAGAGTAFTLEGQPVGPPSSFTAYNTATAETNLWVPGIWTPIGANSMYAGKLYKCEAGGILGTTSTPTLIWTPRCGQSATPASNITLGATTGTTMIASLAAVPWQWDFTLLIRSLGLAASGATGTGNGKVVIGGLTTAAGIVQSMGATVATTLDNTAATGLVLSGTWGTNNAANTITCQWTSPVYSYN